MYLPSGVNQTKLRFSADGQLKYFPSAGDLGTTNDPLQDEDGQSKCKYHCSHCRHDQLSQVSDPMLELPEELMNSIISFAAPYPDDTYHDQDFYQQCRILCLVNKRLHRLSVQRLYTFINLGKPQHAAPYHTRAIRLHRTFAWRPYLRTYCKDLRLFFQDIVHGDQDLEENSIRVPALRDLAPWMPNVRCLHIQGCAGRARAASTIRYLASCMPLVEEFDLARHDLTYWSLDEIRELLDFKRLRRLALHGVNQTRRLSSEPRESHPATVVVLPNDEQVSTTLPKLSSITISDFGQSPVALAKFLTIAGHLTHFKIQGLHWAWNRHYWDLGQVTAALSRHSSTLVSIHIGCLYGAKGPTNRLDVVEWPALEKLYLSKTCIDFSAEIAANTFLSPKLERLCIDYSLEHQHSESFDAINEREAEWYRDLALLAIKQNARLRSIHIEFNPNQFWVVDPIPEENMKRWPWEWLDEAFELVKREDPEMNMSYSNPPTSRDDYYEFCRTGITIFDSENDNDNDNVETPEFVLEDWDEELGYQGIGPWNRLEILQRERFEQYFSYENTSAS